MDIGNIRIFRPGPAAVIARLCDVLRIPEIIDSVVPWNPAQCRLSPGTRVKALIINLLVDRRALYQVWRFYQHQDLEVLFGPEAQVRAEELNDDALARALDKLAASDLKTLFSSIALRAAATHDAPIDRLHVDTTSISVQGAYEGEGELEITFGFSKDRRPDLKQFLMGLVVSGDGLPVLAQSLAGNTSDKKWYPEVVEQLRATFSPEKLQEIIFIADCALVDTANLALLAPTPDRPQILFISRLPENFGLAEEVKQEAFGQGNWTTIGKFSSKKDAASYKSQSFIREIDGRKYRLVVIHSSTLDRRKENSLARKWQKQSAELEKLSQQLSQRPFACRADAEKAIELFAKEHRDKPFILTGTVTEELKTRYPGRGRPKKNVQPQTEVSYHVCIRLSEDQEAMARQKELASAFILITNLLDEQRYPDHFILREYKEQNTVERNFRFLKSPFLLGPIFIKDKDRVKAMSFVFQLALLVAAYLEYRVAKSLEADKTPLVLPGNRKSTKPTARSLLDMLGYLMVAKQGQDRALINYQGPEVIRCLKLAGFGEDIYLFPALAGG